MASPAEERLWQVGKSLTQCLEYMLQNEVSTDVTFYIRPKTAGCEDGTLSAHKLLLCARSPVFEAMFNGNFAESSSEVLILDCQPGLFKEMLRYIYTDDIELNGSNALLVLDLARKYMLEDLVARCIDYLDNYLCPDNVCNILTYSVRVNEEKLIESCFNVCASKTADVLRSEGFLRMSQDALLTFLKCDRLQFEQEEAVVKACIKWAKRQRRLEAGERNLRDILGDCLFEIRFFQLSSDRFAAVVGDSNVMSEREKYLFAFSSLTKDTMYAEKLGRIGYNTNTRSLTFERSGSEVLGNTPVNMNVEKISFSVNEACSFLGVGVYGGNRNDRHDVHMILNDTISNTRLTLVEFCFTSRGKFVKPIKFDQVVKLSPGKTYILKATVPQNSECLFRAHDTQYLSNPFTRVSINYSIAGLRQHVFHSPLGYIKEFHLNKSFV